MRYYYFSAIDDAITLYIIKTYNLFFSYGRALQVSVLTEWMEKDENILHAQTQLLKRAKANGLAAIGKYEGEESSIWC